MLDPSLVQSDFFYQPGGGNKYNSNSERKNVMHESHSFDTIGKCAAFSFSKK